MLYKTNSMTVYDNDLNKLKTIIQLTNKDNDGNMTCSYYPFTVRPYTDHIYKPKLFSVAESKVICDKLSKKIKDVIKCNVKQYHYRGQEKIVYEGNKLNDIYYVKKKAFICELDNGFAIISHFVQINESLFPKLKVYDNEIHTTQTVYQHTLFDMIVKQSNNGLSQIYCDFNVDDVSSNNLDNIIKHVSAVLEILFKV